jgi:hypothetical protein
MTLIPFPWLAIPILSAAGLLAAGPMAAQADRVLRGVVRAEGDSTVVARVAGVSSGLSSF